MFRQSMSLQQLKMWFINVDDNSFDGFLINTSINQFKLQEQMMELTDTPGLASDAQGVLVRLSFWAKLMLSFLFQK
jgi:hypothetical protein